MSIKVWNYVKGGKVVEVKANRPMKVMDILKVTSTPVDMFGIAISSDGKLLTLDDEVPPGSEVKLVPAIIGG
ncbi:MAG: hypothetical protein J7M13_00250 [Synergistetes bacterium]|nr:hypothetical protein [Synergistota bacterium]